MKTGIVCRLSVRCAVSRQIRLLTKNLLHEFCLEVWADHVSPRREPDREPVLPRLRWRQPSRSCRAGIFASLTRDMSGSRFPPNTPQELRRRVFRLFFACFLLFAQRWACRSSSSVLSLSSKRGSKKIQTQSRPRRWERR